jgi:P-type Ca2+ transporter type 2C
MILWNNLIIDVLPSFALALEPGREDAMKHPRDTRTSPSWDAAPCADHHPRTAHRAVGLTAYFWALGPLA